MKHFLTADSNAAIAQYSKASYHGNGGGDGGVRDREEGGRVLSVHQSAVRFTTARGDG